MPQAIHIEGVVTAGHLPTPERMRIQSALQEAEGKHVRVSIELAKKRRSCPQNAFYWGLVVPMVKDMFADSGTTMTSDDVHMFLKVEIGKHVKEWTLPNGEKCTLPESSTKLNTLAWENWMTEIRVWAAQFGIEIPLPREHMK